MHDGELLVNGRVGLFQEEACRWIGVDQSTLSGWERGERVPKGEFAKRVQRFLAEDKACRTPVAKDGMKAAGAYLVGGRDSQCPSGESSGQSRFQ
jgi:DNA-binding XRE family transcriptional regulator